MTRDWRWWWVCYGPAVTLALMGAVVIGLEIKVIRTIDSVIVKIERIGDPTGQVRTDLRTLNSELCGDR